MVVAAISTSQLILFPDIFVRFHLVLLWTYLAGRICLNVRSFSLCQCGAGEGLHCCKGRSEAKQDA